MTQKIPENIEVSPEYILQLNDYLRKYLLASLNGLKVYKKAKDDNPNLLTDWESNDVRKVFLGTLVGPYKNKLQKKYRSLLKNFDSNWQKEKKTQKLITTTEYVSELNQQLSENFRISYENLDEYQNSLILTNFITDDERKIILDSLKEPFLSAILTRFEELVEAFNNKWLIKQAQIPDEIRNPEANVVIDQRFIDGFKKIDDAMIDFGCPANIFENGYNKFYRRDVLGTPGSINGETFKNVANSLVKELRAQHFTTICNEFLEFDIDTLINSTADSIEGARSTKRERIDSTVDSIDGAGSTKRERMDSTADSTDGNRLIDSDRPTKKRRVVSSRPRVAPLKRIVFEIDKINTKFVQKKTTPGKFSSYCKPIMYKNRLLIKENYGGNGECFFKAMGALFQMFGVHKSDEVVRNEFCDFTARKVEEMLINGNFDEIKSKFDAIFRGEAFDSNDKLDRRIISSYVKNSDTPRPHDLSEEEIDNYVRNTEAHFVAEALVHPTRYTHTNSKNESWANENIIFAAGDYIISVLGDMGVTGLIILNCVKAPQALLLPDFPEYRYRDLVRDRVVVEKDIDPEKVINKLLIVRVGGNHYVVGAHPIEEGEEPRSRYLFDVLQTSWSLRSSSFI